MTIRPILLGTILVVCSFSARAQYGYFNDILNYSRTQSIGTARTQAIGNAQVALGGDMNSAYANPAGLGFNRSSVVTFTPSLNFYNSDSEYFGQNTKDSKANFNIANLGVIFDFAKSDYEDSKFKGGSFAITMTRENNFHSDITYDGYNSTDYENGISRSSIVDYWLDNVYDYSVDPPIPYSLDQLTDFEYYGLFESYLINPIYATDGNGNDFLVDYEKFIGDFPRQVEETTNKGGQYRWDFAAGANYNDILYFGASFNLNTINYQTTSTLYETEFLFNNQPDDAINEVSTRNTLDVRGTGVGGTFGIIARPLDLLRVGISATTPKYYWMREESSRDVFVSYNNFEFVDGDGSSIILEDYYYEEFSESNYNVTTPFKLTTGAAFFLGKLGFISADVDFINYSKAKLKSSDFDASGDNQSIQSLYQNAINWRIGSEFRVSSFRVRGGYSYEGDPYKNSGIDNSISKISGGIGYRNREFFVDISAVHTKWNSVRSPYTIYSYNDPSENISPVAYTENKNLNVSVTFGVNF
ncbi:MAG: hypothetical protein ABJH98_16510 [Reichenbachiella sp.]|uniref:OmpP1/FadL family transporter n=1 Tax=Reichenbachiella sp. TaxID=2184521 RepID=UPI00329722CB